MKNSEFSDKVMKKVVFFEKRRSFYWLTEFLLALAGLIGVVVLFLWLTASSLFETKTLELLTLFREDREIIAEFWQETLNTFWQELPKTEIALGIFALVVLVVLFFLARRKITVTKKRLSDIAKYQNKSKNIK